MSTELVYFSQYGQDRFLDEVFGQKQNGTFIEIGAYDGIRFSNTCFFERFRNWTGICIEPIKERYLELVENRKSININACVYSKSEAIQFTKIDGYAEMLSGISRDYHRKHKNRIKADISYHGGKYESVAVNAVTLNQIFDEYELKDVDYCSIDTEGSEMEIIRHFDFSAHKIKAFSIENNYEDKKLRKFMDKKGYDLVRTIECDEIYMLK